MKPKKNQRMISRDWIDVSMSMKAETYKYNLPLVPFDLWEQVCSFMKWVSDNNNSEAIVSLTLVGDEWRVICWHQEPSGSLHVKFNVEEERNKELLDDELETALKNIHCTIHSHNKAGAGQSGDDKDDELQKIGWHITVGTLNQKKMSTHARFNVQTNAVYEDGVKVQSAYQEFLVFDAVQVVEPINLGDQLAQKQHIITRLHKELTEATPPDNLFPEEWKERIHKPKPTVYTPKTNPGFAGLGKKANQGSFWDKPEWIDEWACVASPHDEAPVMLEQLFKKIIIPSDKVFTFTSYHEDQFKKALKSLNKEKRFNFNKECLEIIFDQAVALGKFCVKKGWTTSDWYTKIEPFIEDNREGYRLLRIREGESFNSVRDEVQKAKEDQLEQLRDEIDSLYGEGFSKDLTEAELKAWAM